MADPRKLFKKKSHKDNELPTSEACLDQSEAEENPLVPTLKANVEILEELLDNFKKLAQEKNKPDIDFLENFMTPTLIKSEIKKIEMILQIRQFIPSLAAGTIQPNTEVILYNKPLPLSDMPHYLAKKIAGFIKSFEELNGNPANKNEIVHEEGYDFKNSEEDDDHNINAGNLYLTPNLHVTPDLHLNGLQDSSIISSASSQEADDAGSGPVTPRDYPVAQASIVNSFSKSNISSENEKNEEREKEFKNKPNS